MLTETGPGAEPGQAAIQKLLDDTAESVSGPEFVAGLQRLDQESVISGDAFTTSSTKKLLGTSASLLVTSALLVVTRSY